jgi:glycosyltransferase involved in cell wall biosynthesis
MRVLMTADAVGGVWQYAVQLASLLTTSGGQVLLATMGPAPTPAQQAEVAALRGVTLRTSTFALEWMPEPWDEVRRAGDWLLSLGAEFAPDVVHLNGYAHADLPWRAPTLVVAHSCVLSWFEAVHGSHPLAQWQEYTKRVSAGLAAADEIVAPSGSMGDALRRLYQLDRRVRVIPNARDGRAWTPGKKQHCILAAGRAWDSAKNLVALDAAATELHWPVYVAGDTEGPAGEQTRLRHVRALGRISADAMQAWMARAAIYALPARYEPFGMSVLEAALSGCALVLGDIPSLRENWSGAARFVHPGRADELLGALRDLTDQPAELTSLAAAARDRAREFSTAAHIAAYETLYRDMVTPHGRTAHTSRTL